MLCQNCKAKEATSHIHSVVNGVVHDTYLCSDCALKLKNTGFTHDDIFDLLSSFLNSNTAPAVKTLRCDCCGASFEEISKTGRVGCGNCYKTFSRQLEPALVRIHGRTSHLGKRAGDAHEIAADSNTKTEKTADNKVEMFKKQLKEAIDNEEYEKAAVLRDEIKKLTEE